MAKPVIRGSGFTLKRIENASSTFWIVVDDASRGDEVTVEWDGPGYWTGTIVAGPVHGKARVNVKYKIDDDDEKTESPGLEDDLADVSITVTNADGESDAQDDQAVIDGP